MNITATKYDGRLFIGTSQYLDSKTYKFGKSINTYNNFLTKFVTQILGFSTDLEIGGKIRTVNIKSLAKHLESVGSEHHKYIEHIAAYTYDELIEGVVNQEKEIFFANFSENKREKLTMKMLKSLVADDKDGVRKQLKKGASGNVQFTIDQHGKATLNTNAVIKHNHRLGLEVKIYSPLTFAVEKGKTELAQLIKNIKGSITVFDTIITREKGNEHKIQQLTDQLTLV